MKVIQIAPTVTTGDAVGNEIIALDAVLKKNNISSRIYAHNIGEKVKKQVKDIKTLKHIHSDDILLYHMSTYSGFYNLIKNAKCKKIVRYHNITPSIFFERYNPKMKRFIEDGLAEIISMNDLFDAGIADSEFNKQDLIKYGYSCPITVLPIILKMEDYSRQPDEELMEKMKNRKGHILLYVGRIAPNKKIEDVISAFELYRRYYEPEAVLIIAGSYDKNDLYYRTLKIFTEINHVENVIFTGHTSFQAILAYYHSADLYLCMSEHEGFCVPLVESMYFRLPILAYQSTAVPETLGEAGVVTDTKDALINAGIINIILHDNGLQMKMKQNEAERLEKYMPQHVQAQFIDFMRQFGIR